MLQEIKLKTFVLNWAYFEWQYFSGDNFRSLNCFRHWYQSHNVQERLQYLIKLTLTWRRKILTWRLDFCEDVLLAWMTFFCCRPGFYRILNREKTSMSVSSKQNGLELRYVVFDGRTYFWTQFTQMRVENREWNGEKNVCLTWRHSRQYFVSYNSLETNNLCFKGLN